ncbi:hypothetical protein [Rhizobacter sp. Root1221]|uniref:hypothetical protein n=1 Tax=Rhizobacter sp. Root1221 TaxID=1736433 RepID=UPI0007015794|nr:hypothetical protein [Rhizobacter sp. Root1221]KQV94753.1 hypothetical protein ASC87_25930 [Rhizobacter sp. Root1221]
MTFGMRTPTLSFRNGLRARLLGRAGSPLVGMAGLGALVIAVATSCIGLEHWLAARERLAVTAADIATEQARLSRAVRPAQPKAAAPRYSARQISQFNAVVRQLNTPWPTVLDAIEHHTPPGVALVLVEPDVAKGTVRIQAEAKELDALFAYVDRLAIDDAFDGAFPYQHETNEQDPNRPARLGFDLRLKPGLPRPEGRPRP